MKTFILSIHILLFAASAWAVNGTFIQLNRASAEMTVDDWRADLEQMAEAGIDTLMVQWSSESPIAYFNTGASRVKYISENYFVLEKLFEANREIGHQVYLGLQNSSRFWSQIKSRDNVFGISSSSESTVMRLSNWPCWMLSERKKTGWVITFRMKSMISPGDTRPSALSSKAMSPTCVSEYGQTIPAARLL